MALAITFALLAAFGFSSGIILVRVATQWIAPATATFFGVLSGAIVIQVLAWSVHWSKADALSWHILGWLVIIAALAYPIARVLNYTAVSMVGASRATPMGAIQPLFAVVLSTIFLGESPTTIGALGTVSVVMGLVLVVKGGAATRDEETGTSLNKLGYLLAAGASISFAVRDIISRHLVSDTLSPLIAAAFALTIGAGMLLTFTFRDAIRSIRTVPQKYIWMCVATGVFQGLAVTGVFLALSRAPVTSVSPLIASSPLMTLGMAHIFLQRLEKVNSMLAAGTLLSVGGIIAVIISTAR